MDVLYDLFCERGVPVHIRSDNGSEFTAQRVRTWLSILSIKPLFVEPGNPWENGYIEPFNGKMRDELLSGEIFYTLKEAQVIIEIWWRHYNTIRPHSSLGYKPPAPAAVLALASQIPHESILECGTTMWGRLNRLNFNLWRSKKFRLTGIYKVKCAFGLRITSWAAIVNSIREEQKNKYSQE